VTVDAVNRLFEAELYSDRPADQWRDDEGRPVLRNDPIDPRALP